MVSAESLAPISSSGSARGRRLGDRIAAVLAAGLVCGSASGDEDDESDCLLQPAVYRYLEQVQDSILSQWELPPDSMANREVVIHFVFEESGWPADARIVSSNSSRLARSASVAIVRAAPFGPIPAAAACLIGLPIRTTLRNPADHG